MAPGLAHANADSTGVRAAASIEIAYEAPFHSRFDSVVTYGQGAQATSEAATKTEIDFDISLVSDYRRGGLSSTNGGAAVQVGIAISHPSGLHAEAWGSNVADNGGAGVELNLSGGYRFALGESELDLGAIYYVFPGVAGANYVEFQGSYSRRLGPIDASLVFAYTPSQASTGLQDNIYAGFDLELPLGQSPVTLFAASGFEDGAFASRKIDWQVGGQYAAGAFTFGLSYLDSANTAALPNAGPAVIAGISRRF